MKTVIALAGLPGSGKSHWAKTQQLPIVAVDDEHRTAKTGVSPSPDDNAQARQRAYERLIETLKQHDTVIFDHTNINKKQRQQLHDYVHEHAPDVRLELRFFDTGFYTCLQRNTGREFDLQPQNILYLALALEQPAEDEGWAEVHIETQHADPQPSPALAALLNDRVFDATALLTELPEIDMLAGTLARMDEYWIADATAAWQELRATATENNIDLSAKRELIFAWLLRDLHRIVNEYFAAAHPEGELPDSKRVCERMYDTVLAPRVRECGLDADLARRLFVGAQLILSDEDIDEADYSKDDATRISLIIGS